MRTNGIAPPPALAWVLLACICLVGTNPVSAFQLGGSLSFSNAATQARKNVPTPVPGVLPSATYSLMTTTRTTRLQATSKDESVSSSEASFLDDITLNPLYLVPYLGFTALAATAIMSDPPGVSQAILDKFIADPIHPGVNEIFATIFNLIGLVGIPLACILMPSAKFQRFPATPFLIASAALGYGIIGPYVMTRQPVTETITKNDLGWFTANVLENKIFNWFMVAVTFSSLFTTGLLDVLTTDFSGLVQGYVDLFSSTAICRASSVDFAILCVTAASLIPEDLRQRGVTDQTKAAAAAAATLLLPCIGTTLYCALRPPLPKE